MVSPKNTKHVSIKPTEFSDSNAVGWFAILEAQFVLGRVKVSSTKFFHSVAALPASVVGRISPEVLGKQSFDALKEAVLSLLERSKPELFESLMRSEALVGNPPLVWQQFRKLQLKSVWTRNSSGTSF